MEFELDHANMSDLPFSKPSKKRQRPERQRSDVTYPRKRAIAACRLCRARKVKCNNARPVCGACSMSNAQCVYEDADDCSPFDSASIAILDRLNQVLSRLDQFPMHNVEGSRCEAPTTVAGAPALNIKQPWPHDIIPASGQAQELPETFWIPTTRTTAESILAWPIFASSPPSELPLVSVLHKPGSQNHEAISNGPTRLCYSTASTKAKTIGIIKDDIPRLVQRFVDYVHIKNPVLDIEILGFYTQNLMEYGIGWDPASCLVLLTCALGSVAQEYKDQTRSTPSYADSSQKVQRDELEVGHAYYNAACRRLGLLGSDLLAPQCHFLAGIYLMYILQPLQAWSQFRLASQAYHIYREMQKFQKSEGEEWITQSRSRRLEQRIYWSCYKAECELRVELELPNSTLSEFCHPDMHPSPPRLSDSCPDIIGRSPAEESSPSSIVGRRIRESRDKLEVSWYYYLTEITLRRIANEILNAFYKTGPSAWTSEVMSSMVMAAEDFELQLSTCINQLPPQLRLEVGHEEMEELPLMIWGRIFEIRCWLSRPFLYHEIHGSLDAQTRDLIRPWVRRAIALCVQGLEHGISRHRHHGTWFSIRVTAASALCILSAKKSEKVELPDAWEHKLRSCIDKMRYWEAEALGVFEVIQTLEALVHNLGSNKDGG